MKKGIIIITLFFSSILVVNAQKGESNIGIKGGYNLAAVSFDGEGETGQRHSFHAGFFGESFLSDYLSIQSELLYSQQGYEIKYSGATFTQKLNYINLPILLKAYPSKNFYVEAGPQIGLAITHKEEFDSNFDLFDISQEFEPSNFDWGFSFGGGVKTNSGVSFGVRYHLGLGDIYEDNKPRNRVWQFSVGFSI
ncbi:porin family protein [Aureibaculum sp. 2210JD6-5]|uniref:porin family protein n=1 Tax=Aureibaculum sp. 2210JD6-5 TaxID=3103957 RepID=UPI002AAEC809|nr:porin family protein [Aureibaculum sp. 2210JD6-5]MDY7393711.1 porin family protein [Aureibaculum sp. 2210JD6-5]